jgi:hypothetical protein
VETIEELVTRSRRAQGLPDRLEDPRTAAYVAAWIRGESLPPPPLRPRSPEDIERQRKRDEQTAARRQARAEADRLRDAIEDAIVAESLAGSLAGVTTEQLIAVLREVATCRS